MDAIFGVMMDIDRERKLKRWSFWRTGIAPNVGGIVIVVSAEETRPQTHWSCSHGKEGGFGSVSEMLTARGPKNTGIERKVADKAVNGKENFVDQKMKAPRPGLCPPCSPRPLPSGSSTSTVALSSILGAGTFVKTQYIPRLAEISNLVNLKGIWSRSEESARGAAEIAGKHFPGAECKWGDKGLDKIIADGSTLGVAVVLAGQAQESEISCLRTT